MVLVFSQRLLYIASLDHGEQVPQVGLCMLLVGVSHLQRVVFGINRKLRTASDRYKLLLWSVDKYIYSSVCITIGLWATFVIRFQS